jgi:hypothetical protein
MSGIGNVPVVQLWENEILGVLLRFRTKKYCSDAQEKQFNLGYMGCFAEERKGKGVTLLACDYASA